MNTTEKLVSLGICFSDKDKLELEKAGCALSQYDAAGDLEEALLAAKDAAAVCVSNVWMRHLPPDFLGRLEKCRLLVVGSTGTDTIDADDAALRGISIANCPRYSAPAVAEHAFALLLSLARRLNNRPERPSDPGLVSYTAAVTLRKGVELRGKTLGIAGYGHVGWHLARLASGFGMKVLVAKRNPPWLLSRLIRHRHAKFVKFGAMLTQSDAVVSVVPPGVRGLFDAEAFGRMRPGCLFVNVGRAQALDEEALHSALENGIVGGAGLDAFSPAGAQALRPLRNVILSPHMAWNTAEAEGRLGRECVKNITSFFAGKPVNLVMDASRTQEE